jgi:hypothetical protein
VRIGLGGIVGASGLFALAAGIVLLAFYPITKQKYLQILAGIQRHEMVKNMENYYLILAGRRCQRHVFCTNDPLKEKND